MRVVGFVAQQRLARHWRALIAAGVLLGLGFGLCLSSLAAARSTASAYPPRARRGRCPGRGGRARAAARAVRTVVALDRGHHRAAGLRRLSRRGRRRRPRPHDRAPRADPRSFPDRDPPAAGRPSPPRRRARRGAGQPRCCPRGHLELGQRLHFRFFNPASSKSAEADITIVGIGTFPNEAVVDETNVVGVFVFTRAFYDTHRDLAVYATSNVDLAPGFDARRDLAAKLGALGHQLQSARVQEQQSVNDALRPLLIVLVALGVLAFGASAVATAQVVQRNRDRVLSDDTRLHTMGMSRRQIPRRRAHHRRSCRRGRGRHGPARDVALVARSTDRAAPRSRSGAGIRPRWCRCGRGHGCDHRDDRAPDAGVLVGEEADPAAGVAPLTLGQRGSRQRRDRRRALARVRHRWAPERVRTRSERRRLRPWYSRCAQHLSARRSR